MMTEWDALAAYVGEINDLLCTVNLLNWDANSNMPAGGARTRGQQLATLTRIAQERLINPALGRLLAAAEKELRDEPETSYRRRAWQQTRQAHEVASRIPPALLGELAAHRSQAEKAWQAARARADFALFAPYLERFVALNRQLCTAIGYADHPYDAMLLRYEPDMIVARLRPLLAELEAGLKPLLEAVLASGRQMPVEVLRGHFPIREQQQFCYWLAEHLGYDLERGHFGLAPHPFEISFGPGDVRITNRYQPHYLGAAIFGMIHETGHALYEQGVAPELARTALATDFLSQYAVGGVSFGTHESQSRLWENQIGRSLPFWQRHLPELQWYFPEALAGITPETFYRAVNHVAPSLIRVEADELTYNFHIMLRVELEMGLLDGTVAVAELPQRWNERLEALLGVVPPDDSVGVLQDIHWSFGQMGTFPAYTIGNVMSAQIYVAAEAQIEGLAEQLAAGEYGALLAWLQSNIYRHGRAYSADELLRQVTGGPLQTAPYLAYLTQKYRALYELT